MTITTTTQIAGPVNNIFQQKLLRRAKALCPYFVGRKPGDVIGSHEGTFTMKWRRFTNLTPTTSALTALTGAESYPTRTASALATTDLTAVLSKYGAHVLLNEEADLINYNGQAAEIINVLGTQAGRSLNRLQRNQLEDSSTFIYADGATAASGVSSIMSNGLLAQAINTLDRNDAMPFAPMSSASQNVGTVPILPAYWGICHVDVAYDISRLDRFTSVEKYAGMVETLPGEFGTVMSAGNGIRFVATSEGTIDTDSGANVAGAVRSTSGVVADIYTTVVFGEEYHGAISLDVDLIKTIYRAGDEIPGIIVINKARGSGGIVDPLDELASMAWKTWHAPIILNSSWGYAIVTAASRLTS